MQDYINSIVKTALANGLTIEQITNNPDAVMKAHLFAQYRVIEKNIKNITINDLK
jgi:hypothetical protein